MDKIQDIMEQWSALQPLSDRDREMLSRRFTIDFNYNSNHIEGYTPTWSTCLQTGYTAVSDKQYIVFELNPEEITIDNEEKNRILDIIKKRWQDLGEKEGPSPFVL